MEADIQARVDFAFAQLLQGIPSCQPPQYLQAQPRLAPVCQRRRAVLSWQLVFECVWQLVFE